MATKKVSEKVQVRLPFLRETKNTYLYGFDRETLDALDPKPAISSLYVQQSASPDGPGTAVRVTIEREEG